jgi:hypothetical protein
MTSTQPVPQPVEFPRLRINDVDYEFRYTHSTQLLMNKWGYFALGEPIPSLIWAAAMAGFADGKGGFRSAGFLNPTEFTDKIDVADDLTPIYDAVKEALKKVAPKAKITLVPTPPAATGTTSDTPPQS